MAGPLLLACGPCCRSAAVQFPRSARGSCIFFSLFLLFFFFVFLGGSLVSSLLLPYKCTVYVVYDVIRRGYNYSVLRDFPCICTTYDYMSIVSLSAPYCFACNLNMSLEAQNYEVYVLPSHPRARRMGAAGMGTTYQTSLGQSRQIAGLPGATYSPLFGRVVPL